MGWNSREFIINNLKEDMDKKELKIDEEEFELEEEVEDQNPEEEMKINEGAWTLEENKKYVFFMTYFKDIFVSKERRKSVKIFKFLAAHLHTRTPRQCRSHFQKLINKHKTIYKLKNYFRTQIGKPIFDQQYKQFCMTMEIDPTLSKLKFKEEEKHTKQMEEKAIQTQQPIHPYPPQSQWNNIHNPQEAPPINGLYSLLLFSHPPSQHPQ